MTHGIEVECYHEHSHCQPNTESEINRRIGDAAAKKTCVAVNYFRPLIFATVDDKTMTKLYTLPALMIVSPPRSPHPPKVNRQGRRMRSMALAAPNELPQRTCTAALDRQICRSLLVTPPKEILLRPTPSFANVKRRKLFKVYYQQPTKPPTPQEVPSNYVTEEPDS